MPHPDNRNWMSLLVGELPEAPPRRTLQDLVESREMWDLSHLNRNLPGGVDRRTVRIGPDGLEAEMYAPRGDGPFPALVYLHGGGWCAGSPANERQLAMRFAANGHVVLNVDYRLAPENPFPAAVVDVGRAISWVGANGESLGAHTDEVAIGGQSAGSNLAAAITVAATTSSSDLPAHVAEAVDDAPRIGALVLMSGIYSFPLLLAEPGSNVGPAELWHQAYLGPNFLRQNRDPLASPVFADLSGFPPTYLHCGDEDSLLGQTLEMAKALTKASVPTTVSVVAGLDHAFQFLEDSMDAVAAEMSRARSWLVEQTGATGGEVI